MASVITKATSKGSKPFVGKGAIIQATKGGKAQAIAQVALNRNGTPMRLWWQVPCDVVYKARVRFLMAKLGHGNLNALGKALLDEAMAKNQIPTTLR